jgi:hypothetical protein
VRPFRTSPSKSRAAPRPKLGPLVPELHEVVELHQVACCYARPYRLDHDVEVVLVVDEPPDDDRA